MFSGSLKASSPQSVWCLSAILFQTSSESQLLVRKGIKGGIDQLKKKRLPVTLKNAIINNIKMCTVRRSMNLKVIHLMT